MFVKIKKDMRGNIDFTRKQRNLLRWYIIESFKDLNPHDLYIKWNQAFNFKTHINLEFNISVPLTKKLYKDITENTQYQWRNSKIEGSDIIFEGGFTYSFTPILNEIMVKYITIDLYDRPYLPIDYYNGEKRPRLPQKFLRMKLTIYITPNKLTQLDRDYKLKQLL